jgi:hypothetical protein
MFVGVKIKKEALLSVGEERFKKREHTPEGYCYNGTDGRREAGEICARLIERAYVR